MDKMRQNHVEEMSRIFEAIQKTRSEHLRRDYMKAYVRMSEELKEYDRWHQKASFVTGSQKTAFYG